MDFLFTHTSWNLSVTVIWQCVVSQPVGVVKKPCPLPWSSRQYYYCHTDSRMINLLIHSNPLLQISPILMT